MTVDGDADLLTGAESATSHGDTDPEWEDETITENNPEVENGGIPEMIRLLDWDMQPSLSNMRWGNQLFSDNSQNFLDLAQVSPSLVLVSDASQGHGIAAPPPSPVQLPAEMRFRSDSISVSDESNDNKFPDEKPYHGINFKTSKITRPDPITEDVSDPSSDSSVLMGSEDMRRSRPWVRVNPDPDDEIAFAVPLWDEVDPCAPPNQAGAGPGWFNPDPASRNKRSIRQRLASARQTLREYAQEDRQWIRERMARIGIRVNLEPAENRRPAIPRPQPAVEEASRSQQGTGRAGLRARLTPFLSLRGGSGTPPEEKSQDESSQRGQSRDNNRSRDASQGESSQRGQSQDNNRSRDASQGESSQRGQTQDNDPPYMPLLGNPILRDPRQRANPPPYHSHSYNGFLDEHRLRDVNNRRDENPRRDDNPRRADNPRIDDEGYDSGDIPAEGPFLERPPQFGQSPYGEQGSATPQQRPRPSEYEHPAARAAREANQRGSASNAAARGGLYGSPFTRPPSRHGHRQLGHHGNSGGSIEGNEPRSPRPSNLNPAGSSANQSASQNMSQNDGQNDGQNSSRNGSRNVSWRGSHNASPNVSQDVNRPERRNSQRTPSPMPALPDVPLPSVEEKKQRKKDDLSTLGKDAGKKFNKFKEQVTNFASLGRKTKPPASPPPRQIPEPRVLEDFTPTPSPGPTLEPAPATYSEAEARAAAAEMRARAARGERPVSPPVREASELPSTAFWRINWKRGSLRRFFRRSRREE